MRLNEVMAVVAFSWMVTFPRDSREIESDMSSFLHFSYCHSFRPKQKCEVVLTETKG